MTETTNIGLKKIDGSDNWRQIFDDYNDSMDAVDSNIASLQDALGIVCNGNKTAVAASAGQYVILKNSTITGCSDGLYKAAQTIPADTVIDSTYLTADASGGLNDLQAQVTSLNSKFMTKHLGVYSGDGIAVGQSNDVTISGISSTGYKVISLANLTTTSGKFIAMPLSNTDTSITFRLVNVGTELVAPGTLYFDALYMRA